MNKKWSILIYVIIITAVMISLFTYIATQALGNLSLLNSIKKSLSLEISGRWLYEEMLTAYQDDPVYGKIKTSRTDYRTISRYRDFIQASTNIAFPYVISLTEVDNEYGNSLKALKYADVFWNDIHQNMTNPCNLSLSYLKWDKGDMQTLANNKIVLTATGFPSLISASYSSLNTIDIYFSTGVTHSGSILSASDFIYNGPGILQSVAKVNNTYYTGTLSQSVTLSTIDCKAWCNLLGLVPGAVQSGTKTLEPDTIAIGRERKWYSNRYRIKDNGSLLNLVSNNMSLSLSSSAICFFWLEGGDVRYRIIPLPDKKAQTDIQLFDAANPAISRIFQYTDNIKLWVSFFLSNYLYKIY